MKSPVLYLDARWRTSDGAVWVPRNRVKMSKKVFAGGLPWEAEDSDLSAAFSHFGPVEDAKVIMDKETGKSRGFGFVTFADDADADEACNIGEIEMNVGGRNRTVRIDQANDRPERGGGGGGRSGGGGGGGRDRDRGGGRERY